MVIFRIWYRLEKFKSSIFVSDITIETSPNKNYISHIYSEYVQINQWCFVYSSKPNKISRNIDYSCLSSVFELQPPRPSQIIDMHWQPLLLKTVYLFICFLKKVADILRITASTHSTYVLNTNT